MDLFDAINKRCSYRGLFLDKPVPVDDLKRIVDAGIRAPSGCNAQTTDFVIITGQDRIDSVSGIIKKTYIKTAKAIIACIVTATPVYNGHSFEVEDCSAAVENMLLAITALGYATVWLDGILRIEKHADSINRLLLVPPHKCVRVILPIGVPAEICHQNTKKPFTERAYFNQYPG